MAYDGSRQPRKRRQWPEAEQRRMVREVAESGLSIAKVARRNDVHPSVLARWCRNAEVDGGTALVPVQVTAPAPAPRPPSAEPPLARAANQVEVILVNGRRLLASEDVPPAWLRALVTALEEA